ncbi:hypothetical protein BKA62DRAFT_776489 [Auriculariales sp. MPI-PUGE-AT-0066]|nr:hypothetical protein BKA62DRAFT_776489 [Auriculariales sp. MPI-PUGE-AT-0066]
MNFWAAAPTCPYVADIFETCGSEYIAPVFPTNIAIPVSTNCVLCPPSLSGSVPTSTGSTSSTSTTAGTKPTGGSSTTSGSNPSGTTSPSGSANKLVVAGGLLV